MNRIPAIDIYVRYCETDAGGHVSNTSYFLYMEEGRTRFFELLGFGPRTRKGINFIVASTECDFIAQAYASQTLSISTEISHIGNKSFTMVHEIFNLETGALIAIGRAVIVCYNFQEQQSVSIPPNLRNRLEQFLANVSI
ncbi:thioesterase family protein [Sporosarcina sp. 179-K 3D1 HS]|uniref:acyl-CoA thioesterase n=1 Tax=Sporosarcina sp. 179-K 3D1 HS TaxID=3232169 RepID=UPI00399FAD8D